MQYFSCTVESAWLAGRLFRPGQRRVATRNTRTTYQKLPRLTIAALIPCCGLSTFILLNLTMIATNVDFAITTHKPDITFI